jgi:tRNA/rRNA methyltransferase
MASGAIDVLDRAQIFSSLDDALADRHFAVAFTARRRELAHGAKPLREAILHAAAEWLAEPDKRIALVFGNETFGMSNDEADRCQMIATIPANPEYTSLNVSQAIQLAAYEVMMAANAFAIDEAPVRPAASVADVEGFLGHLEAAAVASKFLDPAEPKRFMTRMRRLFARARMEPEEVAILRGLLAALVKGRANPDK